MIGLKLLRKRLCHTLVDTAVEVDGEFHVHADRFANGAGATQHRVDLFKGVDVVHFLRRVHLYGAVALSLLFQNLGRDIRGAVAADPAVNLQSVAALAAQQVVNRRVQRLSLDVPQRLINTRDGAHNLRPAAVEAAAVEGLPQILDVRGILSHKVIAELLNGGLHGVRAAFDNRLAPAA